MGPFRALPRFLNLLLQRAPAFRAAKVRPQRRGAPRRQQKTPALFRARGFGVWPGGNLLSRAECALSSAQTRFTVLFGMGRRGSGLLWPPDRHRRVNSYKVIVRSALRLEPLYEAEIVTVVGKSTMFVFTVKVALVAPAGTVTLEGTVAALVSLLESVT